MAERTAPAVPIVCAVCGMRSHPRWRGYACPGVRCYAWEQIPSHLATKTQMGREGLRPVGDPAGCYIAWTRKSVVYLYDRTTTRPKRVLSEKQQAALVRSTAAMQAARGMLAVQTTSSSEIQSPKPKV